MQNEFLPKSAHAERGYEALLHPMEEREKNQRAPRSVPLRSERFSIPSPREGRVGRGLGRGAAPNLSLQTEMSLPRVASH